MKVDVVDSDNKKVQKIELDDAVFGAEVKPHLMHEVVRAQLAAARAGTASTKHRSDVSGSTAKLYRQKGTGRARTGSVKGNVRVGGGSQFGPKPRSYDLKVNRKVRKAALRSALSMKAAEGKLVVVKALKLDEPKTKLFLSLMSGLGVEDGLVVTASRDETMALGSRNARKFKVLSVAGLNVYDLLRRQTLVIASDAIESVQGRART